MKFKFFITAIIFFIFALFLFVSSLILKINNIETGFNAYIDIVGWLLFSIGWIFNIIALLKR